MSDLPAPLTPPECDLRGLEWMPLYGYRLFMSDFEARATDAEFRVALRLWWTAWQQVPAASLPNDDAILCRLAGLGRDIKAWKKLRSGAALRGFVECSDGRLYHHLLSEEAKNAWDRRVKGRERKAAYRQRKSAGQNADVPQDTTGTGQGRNADVPSMSQKEVQDRTGQVQDSTPLPPYDLAGVSLRQGDGRPIVNGWYLDRTWERVAEAAKLDQGRWRGDLAPLVAWLRDEIEPDTIVAAVERVAARPSYSPPFSLGFFDGAVREQRKVAA